MCGEDGETIIKYFALKDYIKLEIYVNHGLEYAINLLNEAKKEYMKPNFKD